MYNHKATEWKHRTDIAIYRHPIYTKEDRVRKEEGEEEKRHRRKYEEMSEAEKRKVIGGEGDITRIESDTIRIYVCIMI